MNRPTLTSSSQKQLLLRAASAFIVVAALAGCDANGQFAVGKGETESTAAASGSTKLVERDVEAPDVFSVTDQGLWDGRPSLGGVWVAHPDVTDPERVIIRNEANGKFVIGALFRRERDLPGPKLQISSDAAAALNVLAGGPAPLNVTALRREEGNAPVQDSAPAATVETPADVTETVLDPVTTAANAAIEAAPATPAAAVPAATPKPKTKTDTKKASSLRKPFVQIGIFSVEANADRAANQMRSAGMLPDIKRSEIDSKAFWRVMVGPVATQSEMNTLLKSIKSEGFSDAYAVSN